MTNRPGGGPRYVIALCDSVALVGSFLAAGWAGDTLFPLPEGTRLPNLWFLALIVPTWAFFLRRFGLQHSFGLPSPERFVGSLAKTQIMGGLVLFASMSVVRSLEISRLFLALFIVLSAVAIPLVRLMVAAGLRAAGRERLLQARRVVVVENGAKTRAVLDLLEGQAGPRGEVVGMLSTNGNRANAMWDVPVLGHVADFEALLSEGAIDEVIAVSPPRDAEAFSRLASACVERGITFRTMLELTHGSGVAPRVEEVGNSGSYMLSLESVPRDAVSLFVKRLVDIAGAVVGLTITALVYPWYRLRLQRESPGPVLFEQTRVGQNGRRFKIYKFRTMHPDADKQREVLSEQNEMQGMVFKIQDDPRILDGARAIRKRHLDELPQFWNVLKGEMSLVGTRPPTTDEVAKYAPHHYRRLTMKPGITGLWQVQGNDAISDFEDIVQLDCEYIKQWSIWLDLRILARTVEKVARGDGW